MTRPPRRKTAQPSPDELARRRALLADLGKIGFFRRGTLLSRFTRCGKSGCRCQADPPQLHGPYWQWTRKVKGKTVTVTLSESQAAMLREWLDNGRLYDRQLAELEQLSVQVTDRLLAAASAPPG
jgi:hypothetical protein